MVSSARDNGGRPMNETIQPINWATIPQVSVWVDEPDALEELGRRVRCGKISRSDEPLIEQYIREGGFTLEGAISSADIDEVNAYFEYLWTTDKPEDIVFLGFTLKEIDGGRAVAHSELVHLSREERLRLSKLSPWRIHGLGTSHPAAKRIFWNERMMELSAIIFDKPAVNNSTIN